MKMKFGKNFRDYGILNANGKPRFPFTIPPGSYMYPLAINGQVAMDNEGKHRAHGLTLIVPSVISVTEYMVWQDDSYMHMAQSGHLPLMHSAQSKKLWYVSALRLPELNNNMVPVSNLKIETPKGTYAYIAIDDSWLSAEPIDKKWRYMLRILNTDYLLVEFATPRRPAIDHYSITYWGFAIFIR